MHHPFMPPRITGTKSIGEYLTAHRIWEAFRAFRESATHE